MLFASSRQWCRIASSAVGISRFVPHPGSTYAPYIDRLAYFESRKAHSLASRTAANPKFNCCIFCRRWSDSATVVNLVSRQDDQETLTAWGPRIFSPDGSCIFLIVKNRLHAILASSGASRWFLTPSLRVRAEGSLCSSPDGARLFVELADGNLCALQSESGKTLWNCHVGTNESEPGQNLGPVVLNPGGTTIFVATKCGSVHALDAATGSTRWEFLVGQAIPPDFSFSVTPDGELMVFWAGDGNLHAVGTNDGKQKWIHMHAGAPPMNWSISISNDGSFMFFIASDLSLHCINSASGKERWVGSGFAKPNFVTLTPDDTKILVGTVDGNLHALAADTGKEDWQYDLGCTETVVAVISPHGDTAFVGDSDGQMHAVIVNTGESKWVRKHASAKFTHCEIDPHGTTIFAQTSDNILHALDTLGEQKWFQRLNNTGVKSFIVGVDGSRAFLDGQDAHLKAVRTTSGEKVWALSLLDLRGRISDGSPTGHKLNRATILRNKRYVVLLVCLAIVGLRSSGWPRKPHHADSGMSLEDLVSLLGGLVGSSQAVSSTVEQPSSPQEVSSTASG